LGGAMDAGMELEEAGWRETPDLHCPADDQSQRRKPSRCHSV
jgi:hypothetical protein